jgi:hypothetical protein
VFATTYSRTAHNAFPMTVTGKMQKFTMREQMIEDLGLAERETA